MDYFSCYKLSNKSPSPFQEEKNSPKLKDCQIFSEIKVLGWLLYYCRLPFHYLK